MICNLAKLGNILLLNTVFFGSLSYVWLMFAFKALCDMADAFN